MPLIAPLIVKRSATLVTLTRLPGAESQCHGDILVPAHYIDHCLAHWPIAAGQRERLARRSGECVRAASTAEVKLLDVRRNVQRQQSAAGTGSELHRHNFAASCRRSSWPGYSKASSQRRCSKCSTAPLSTCTTKAPPATWLPSLKTATGTILLSPGAKDAGMRLSEPGEPLASSHHAAQARQFHLRYRAVARGRRQIKRCRR